MSQCGIVVATASVRQHRLGYIRDYFELATQECLCVLFGNMAVGIFVLFLKSQTMSFFAMLHSENQKKGTGHIFVSNLIKS